MLTLSFRDTATVCVVCAASRQRLTRRGKDAPSVTGAIKGEPDPAGSGRRRAADAVCRTCRRASHPQWRAGRRKGGKGQDPSVVRAQPRRAGRRPAHVGRAHSRVPIRQRAVRGCRVRAGGRLPSLSRRGGVCRRPGRLVGSELQALRGELYGSVVHSNRRRGAFVLHSPGLARRARVPVLRHRPGVAVASPPRSGRGVVLFDRGERPSEPLDVRAWRSGRAADALGTRWQTAVCQCR